MKKILDFIDSEIEFLKSSQQNGIDYISPGWNVLVLNRIKELLEQTEWERVFIPEGEYEKDASSDNKKEAGNTAACNERGNVWRLG